MRVFTGSLATETNTFSPLPTGLSAFTDREYFKGGTHPARMTFYGGPLWAARERAATSGWTLIEGLVASAQPGGTTTRHAYETLRDELLDDVRRAMPLDLVLLGLQGQWSPTVATIARATSFPGSAASSAPKPASERP